MSNKYPLFKKARNRKLLYATLLEVFFILILQPIINFLIMDNQMINFTDLFNAGITSILIVLFVVYAGWKIWKWRKEDIESEKSDAKLKREDFIKTLIEVLEAQRDFTDNTINNHVLGLKHNFIEPIKKIAKKEKIDKEAIIKLMDYEFDHHKTARGNRDKIDDLVRRLELHKNNEIIQDIRFEQSKNEQKE